MVIAAKHQLVIDTLLERLTTEFEDHIHAVILFGSVARGEATRESDIDILVITDGSHATKKSIDEIAYDLDLENGVLTQVVFFTRGGFENEATMRSWFFADVVAQGKVLYDDGTYRRIREGQPQPVKGVSRR